MVNTKNLLTAKLQILLLFWQHLVWHVSHSIKFSKSYDTRVTVRSYGHSHDKTSHIKSLIFPNIKTS